MYEPFALHIFQKPIPRCAETLASAQTARWPALFSERETPSESTGRIGRLAYR